MKSVKLKARRRKMQTKRPLQEGDLVYCDSLDKVLKIIKIANKYQGGKLTGLKACYCCDSDNLEQDVVTLFLKREVLEIESHDLWLINQQFLARFKIVKMFSRYTDSL